MEYLFLIPVSVTFFYEIFMLYKTTKKRVVLYSIIVPFILLITFFIVKKYVGITTTSIIVFNLLIIINFVIQRFENKVSILFILIFLTTIGLIAYLSFSMPAILIYLMICQALIFLLAENNQIFIRKTYEDSAAEYQNKILDKQVEEVKNIYLTMRGWRHDYHNHLQKLKAHIMMNQIKEANEYLNELEIDLDNVNQLVESGNINLDAILNSKISLAIKSNIAINYKAEVPKKLTVSDIDLCVLIGNLIDNAVEACEKIKNDIPKFIRIYIGIFKKQLYISVSNSTNEVVRKLDEEYITTKRGNHGHGLKRINIIVNKYDGFINRKNEPGVFVSEVLLPL